MWSKQKAVSWAEQKGWIVGFNYVPAYAVNSTEMWQKESFQIFQIDRELCAAASQGYNACRVFLPFILWKYEHESFMENLENFLQTAQKYKIWVVPIFFDDCAFSNLEPYLGKQKDPVKGIHNSGWTPSPGPSIADDPQRWPELKDYVTEIISKYAQDDRILFWDLYNEPGNSDRKEKSLPLMRQAFEWARETDPAQPLTTGVWLWESFDLSCLEQSDILTFHDYCPLDVTMKRVQFLQELGRPIFCTEWLNRGGGNTFETHLPYFYREKVGTFHWGMVVGKTQTNLNGDPTKNCYDGQPAVWQHDIFYPDLTLYRPEEMSILRELLNAKSN